MKKKASSFFHLTFMDNNYLLGVSHFNGKGWERREYNKITPTQADTVVKRLYSLGGVLFATTINKESMSNHIEYRR